jgi:SAM-dependent methyltransferase
MIYKYVPKPFKKYYKRLYWRVFYNYIGSLGILKKIEFLNYGYADEGVQIKDFTWKTLNQVNKNLYLHLMKQATIDGKNFIEIGCGRGAGLNLLTEHYKPARAVGVDISDRNIKLAKKMNKGNIVEFYRADAEKQIFPDKSFDVILNLESAHCYASKFNFFKNVHSIMKDDGRFLYSDLFWGEEQINSIEKQLTEIGFEILKKEDITQPVLRAINVLADIRKYCAGTSLSPKKYINNFLAVEDSTLNEGFKSGYIKYLFYTLKNK